LEKKHWKAKEEVKITELQQQLHGKFGSAREHVLDDSDWDPLAEFEGYDFDSDSDSDDFPQI
jgi:hypothetical protein